MIPVKDNQATEFVYGKFFEYDFDTNEVPAKEDIEKFASISNFSDYVFIHAMRCGYSGDASDTTALVTFVSNKCKEANVGISRQTLANWLTKGLPANTASGRENVYRLCFAL